VAVSVASALISLRLDQLNSILYGTLLRHTTCLQRIQHEMAWVVLYQHSHTSPLCSNELLKQLHGLPIEWHVWFKLATLTFKALHTGRLQYLSNLLQHHKYEVSALIQLSSAFSPLPQLNVWILCFRFFAPRVWNSLPVGIRESRSLPTFRRHLKTSYFQSARPPFNCPPCLEYLRPRALICQRLRCYIIHVLTYFHDSYGPEIV